MTFDIQRDPKSGDRRPALWYELFEMLGRLNIPEDFLDDRDNAPAQEREPFS